MFLGLGSLLTGAKVGVMMKMMMMMMMMMIVMTTTIYKCQFHFLHMHSKLYVTSYPLKAHRNAIFWVMLITYGISWLSVTFSCIFVFCIS